MNCESLLTGVFISHALAVQKLEMLPVWDERKSLGLEPEEELQLGLSATNRQTQNRTQVSLRVVGCYSNSSWTRAQSRSQWLETSARVL